MAAIKLQIERGSKRVFATAVDWPGWSRSAKDENGALEALLEYGSRYKRSIGVAGKALSIGTLQVVEHSKGDSTTDFGAPAKPLADDDRRLSGAELKRLTSILQASWRAFDRAAKKAERVSLRTGPRGGGRSVAKMRAHVLEADGAYLRKIGGTAGHDLDEVRRAFLDALPRRANGEIPDVGPRGGTRWPARYAIRRSAWHSLDHAWEIEDRS